VAVANALLGMGTVDLLVLLHRPHHLFSLQLILTVDARTKPESSMAVPRPSLYIKLTWPK
jgi:hypothetical protein